MPSRVCARVGSVVWLPWCSGLPSSASIDRFLARWPLPGPVRARSLREGASEVETGLPVAACLTFPVARNRRSPDLLARCAFEDASRTARLSTAERLLQGFPKTAPPSAWPLVSTPGSPRRLPCAERLRQVVARRPTCSALVVSHHRDGLLHQQLVGLLRPTADPGVHRVSAACQTIAPWPASDASPPMPYPPELSPPAQPYLHHCKPLPSCRFELRSWRQPGLVRLQGFAPCERPLSWPAVAGLPRPMLSWASLFLEHHSRRPRSQAPTEADDRSPQPPSRRGHGVSPPLHHQRATRLRRARPREADGLARTRGGTLLHHDDRKPVGAPPRGGQQAHGTLKTFAEAATLVAQQEARGAALPRAPTPSLGSEGFERSGRCVRARTRETKTNARRRPRRGGAGDSLREVKGGRGKAPRPHHAVTPRGEAAPSQGHRSPADGLPSVLRVAARRTFSSSCPRSGRVIHCRVSPTMHARFQDSAVAALPRRRCQLVSHRVSSDGITVVVYATSAPLAGRHQPALSS